MQRRELLEKAWSLIDTSDKWCVGELEDGQGRYCAMGALNMAYHDSPYWWGGVEPTYRQEDWLAAAQLLADCIPDELFDPYSFSRDVTSKIAYYNNNHTHDDVKRMFECAISKS